MGGGNSSILHTSTKLTINEFKELCGSQYSIKLSLALQNEQQLIDSSYLSLLNDLTEKEVLFLYLLYCQGEMNLQEYVTFCIDTKLLSKRYFSRKESESFFLKYSKNNKINYLILRFQIFPEIATKRELPIDRLLLKLSFCEGPIKLSEEQSENINKEKENEQEVKKQIKEEVKDQGKEEEKEKEQQNQQQIPHKRQLSKEEEIDEKITTFTPEQLTIIRKALTQLQKVWRINLATKEIAVRKEIRRLESTAAENISYLGSNINLAVGPPKTLEEKNCLDLFNRYTNDEGEMSLQDFLNFCHFTNLIPTSSALLSSNTSSASASSIKKQFTKLDAQIAFKKTIAMFYDINIKGYREGVRFGKRIIFSVFRLVLLPEIAIKKHLKIEELLRILVRVKRRVSFDDEMDFLGEEDDQ